MKNKIEAVGGIEEMAQSAYQAGFGDGYEAARAVLEVFAGDERQSGGIYSASAMLEALDKARAKALEMMSCPPALKRIPVMPESNTIN